MEHLTTPPQSLAPLTHQSAIELIQRGYAAPGRPYGFENPDDDDSDGGILEYLRILRRHKGTILLAAVAGLVLGVLVGIPMKPRYEAQTSLEVLTLNQDFMNMKGTDPTSTNDGNFDTSEEQTQSKLLESSALINRAIVKLDPDAAAVLAKQHIATSGWRSWFHMAEPTYASPRTILLLKAADTLKVRPTAHTRVLEITVSSTDAKIAADFANTLTEQFIAMNIESRWATSQRTSEWLRRELEDGRARLRQSQDALQAYARQSGLIFTDETTNVATEKLQQVQANLSAATADRIAKQANYELASTAPPSSLGDVLNDPSLRDTTSKINDLKRQIADLSAVYSPEYSKVRRFQAELDALEPAFDTQRTAILGRIKNDFTESTRKEKLLEQAYNIQAHEVTGQDEKAIQYNILQRDVDSNRQLYDAMLQQMKQASIVSAMRASNVRIVDPAEVPVLPVWPNFKITAAVGLLLGLSLSMVVVTMKERADRTLQQPGDIKLWLNMPELGIIPSSSIESRSAMPYRSAAVLKGERSFIEGRKASHHAPLGLVTSGNKPSLIAEAFRSALTSILFVGENGSRPKVLVFTSANAADGKTTVVSNIAIAAAEIRFKVLVIDADLRRPRMHNLFGLNNDSGLADLLKGDVAGSAAPEVIQKTEITNLDVLTAGQATSSVAHLLYSPHFKTLIDACRSEYDLILIDTPPMLQMTDARVAGRLGDAVVLVGRSGRTTRDALLAAKERLAEDRIPILGSILNDWDPKKFVGGYYGYYQPGKYAANHY